jgi:hypothetical protein
MLCIIEWWDDYWIGKRVKEGGRGLMWSTIPSLPGETEEDDASRRPGIWTRALRNTNEDCYPLDRDVRWDTVVLPSSEMSQWGAIYGKYPEYAMTHRGSRECVWETACGCSPYVLSSCSGLFCVTSGKCTISLFHYWGIMETLAHNWSM